MQAVSEIEQVGREIAYTVVGDGVIDDVRVRQGWSSSDEPTYEFFFRVDPERVPFGPGLMLIRLAQGLHQALEERGDEHMPVVHLLNHEDWHRWARA